MATADYYRKQAETCLHMSRICHDPILADHLDVLATEFMEAAADQDGCLAGHDVPAGLKRANG